MFPFLNLNIDCLLGNNKLYLHILQEEYRIFHHQLFCGQQQLHLILPKGSITN